MINILPTIYIKSPFMLYAGGLFGIVFLVSLIIIFSMRRKCPVVVPLTNPPSGERFYEYIVSIQTSLLPYSGLSPAAKVHIKLIGEFHDSSVFLLKKNKITQDILHRGALDMFVIHTKNDLGNITAISVDISSNRNDIWRPAIISVFKPITNSCWISWKPDVIMCKARLRKIIRLEHYYSKMKTGRNFWTDYLIFVGVKHLLLSHFITSVRFGTVSSPVFLLLFYFLLAGIFTATLIVYVYNQDLLIPDDQQTFNINSFEWRSIDLGLLISVASSWFMEALIRNIKPTRLKPGFIFRGLQDIKLYDNLQRLRKIEEEEQMTVPPEITGCTSYLSRLDLPPEGDMNEFVRKLVNDVGSNLSDCIEKRRDRAEMVAVLEKWNRWLEIRLMTEIKDMLSKDRGNFPSYGNSTWASAGPSREELAKEQAARDKAAKEQAAREQAAREKAAREQAGREQAARDKAAREQAAREQAAREQAAREQAAREEAAMSNADLETLKPATSKTSAKKEVRFKFTDPNDKKKGIVVCQDCDCPFCTQVKMRIKRDCCFLLDIVTRAVLKRCKDALVKGKKDQNYELQVNEDVDAVKTVCTYVIEKLQCSEHVRHYNIDLKDLPIPKKENSQICEHVKKKYWDQKKPEMLAHVYVNGVIAHATETIQRKLNNELISLPTRKLHGSRKVNFDSDDFAECLLDDIFIKITSFLYQQQEGQLNTADLVKTLDRWLEQLEKSNFDLVNQTMLPERKCISAISQDSGDESNPIYHHTLPLVFYKLTENLTVVNAATIAESNFHGDEFCLCQSGPPALTASHVDVDSSKDESITAVDASTEVIKHSAESRMCNCRHCQQVKVRIRRDCTFLLVMVIKAVMRACHKCLLQYNRKSERYIMRISQTVSSLESTCSALIEQLQCSNNYQDITPKSRCCGKMDESLSPDKAEKLAHVFIHGVVSVIIIRIHREIIDELDSLSPCEENQPKGLNGNFSEDFVYDLYAIISGFLYQQFKGTFRAESAMETINRWQRLLEIEVLKQLGHDLTLSEFRVSLHSPVKSEKKAVKKEEKPVEKKSQCELLKHDAHCGCEYCTDVKNKLFKNSIMILQQVLKDDNKSVREKNFDKQFLPIVNRTADSMTGVCVDVITWLRTLGHQSKGKEDFHFPGWDSLDIISKLPAEIKKDAAWRTHRRLSLKLPKNTDLESTVQIMINEIVKMSEDEANLQLVENTHVQSLCSKATHEALDEIWKYYQNPCYAFTVFLIQQKAIQKLINIGKNSTKEQNIPTLVKEHFSYALYPETEAHFEHPDTMVSEAWMFSLLHEMQKREEFINNVKTTFSLHAVVQKIEDFVNRELDKIVKQCLEQACYKLAVTDNNTLAISIIKDAKYMAPVYQFLELIVQCQVECDLASAKSFQRVSQGVKQILLDELSRLASENLSPETPRSKDQKQLNDQRPEPQRERSDTMGDVFAEIHALSKDIKPLTTVAQFMKEDSHRQHLGRLEKQVVKTERRHKELVAINLQNIVDSYYVSAELPEGYTERELYIVEWAMTNTLHKPLPAELRKLSLLVLFFLTSLTMIYFVLKGAELTTPQAKEWACLTAINVCLYIVVFEPLKLLLVNMLRRTWPYF